MATPQSDRLALTPKTPAATANVTSTPFTVSTSGGSRVLRTPLSDEAIWKRLKEAGFDEDSIKRRDKATLIAYIAKLEAEVYDVQYQMGLLLMEKKDWLSQHDQLKAIADTAEFTCKREKAAHASDLAEAKKREDALKKALGIEKECVANIEKALHEMRAECAEAKVVAESKLAEALSMMEEAQKKFTEAESKLHAAQSLEAESSRFHRTAERKLREVEQREDDLRRRMISFKSDCDAKENEIQLERQTLRERQKVLQQSQEGLLDGQALFNQREEYILHRSQELSKLEKQLEASKSAVKDERRGLNEEKQKLELMTKSLDAREEAVLSKECELKKKEEGLLLLQGKLASKEFDGIQQAMANGEAALSSKKSTLEAELLTKSKSVDEEIEAKRRNWELREIDMKEKEDLLLEKEHDLESQSRALIEKEKNLEDNSHLLEEKEKNLIATKEKLELKNSILQQEKDEINRMKLELQKALESLEDREKQIHSAEARVEEMKTETNELLILETNLKQEIDIIRAEKLELEAEAEQLKTEKAKFETEWELIDEKREELRKEAERVAEERVTIYKFLKDGRDSLKSEKDAMRDQYKLDLESLSHDREAFMNEMQTERSKWFNKIKKEREDFLLDIQIQKEELDNRADKRREEIENYLKDREGAFEEEKKKELEYIASLRETLAKETEFVNSEMVRLENERKEISLDREKRDREWAELNSSIEELKLQRQKLEKQRELLRADREEILSQIEELKKLEDLKYNPDRIALPRPDSQSNSTKRLLPQKTQMDSGQTGDLNGTRHGLAGRKRPDNASSPFSASLSWLKHYADTLFDQKQSNKRRRQGMDVSMDSETLLQSPLAVDSMDTATPVNQSPVTPNETTVYIDKTTIREVVVERVTGEIQECGSQEGERKLENNSELNIDESGKLETNA